MTSNPTELATPTTTSTTAAARRGSSINADAVTRFWLMIQFEPNHPIGTTDSSTSTTNDHGHPAGRVPRMAARLCRSCRPASGTPTTSASHTGAVPPMPGMVSPPTV